MDDRVPGLLGERARVDLAALSEREREVLELALTGLSARAIADRLTLTEATIRSHLARIYAKLGVGGRVELLAHFHGQPPGEGGSLPSPSVETTPPRRRRAWRVAALAVLLVTVSAGTLFLWLRPDLPPATDLATVSQLVAQGRATSLDLRGDTFFVSTADGRHYRVDGVDEAAFYEMLPEVIGTTVEVSISGGGDTLALVSILAFVSATLPLVVLLLVAAFVAFRWLRRPPQPRPAG
ncbi:MAG: helix-turn-helix transcriptional regulator [Candidatus Limnocylindrales bacterium]|jgi:DNA-binding CsgD family transcriptional regulator